MRGGVYLLFLSITTGISRSTGTCPSNEAVSLLQMERVVGEWNGTHISGDKTDCSRVQITARTESEWTLTRTSTLTGKITSVTFQQPDRTSGHWEVNEPNGGKYDIIVMAANYNSHLLMQECPTEGNVTTSYLQRRVPDKTNNEDTELVTALYDINVPLNKMQFCQRHQACRKWPTVVPSLDEKRIRGTWREAGRLRMPGSIQKRPCVYLIIEPIKKGGLSIQYSYNKNEKKICVHGNARYKYPNTKQAILTLNETGMNIGEFWILDTNYDSYAVVSICASENSVSPDSHGGEVFVLTRSGSVTSSDAFAINAALISAGKKDFVDNFEPGFDRLDKMLDIPPQACEPSPATCGVRVGFRTSSLLLLSGFLLLIILR